MEPVTQLLSDEALARLVRVLSAAAPEAAATPEDRIETASRRRIAVRLVEECVRHANPTRLPTIPVLCDLAGVSERNQ